jgi:hypothetical protein
LAEARHATPEARHATKEAPGVTKGARHTTKEALGVTKNSPGVTKGAPGDTRGIFFRWKSALPEQQGTFWFLWEGLQAGGYARPVLLLARALG